MTLIYIVTSGCYSDYSIRACFSTRAAAQALIDEWKDRGHHYDEPRIEEWDLDDEVRPDDRHRRISVDLAENGDTIRVLDRHPNGAGLDQISWWCWNRPGSTYTQRGIYFSGTVWARDADHAIKMARDARAASIAAGDLDRIRAEPRQDWKHQRASLPTTSVKAPR